MESPNTRRTFLRDLAVYGGALTASSYVNASLVEALQGAGLAQWKDKVGLELFTVRDVLQPGRQYEETLEKLAAIGYREIEPAGGYNNMTPKDYRAMLDRLKLSMPSTHSGASGATLAEVEKVLEGFQIMGIRYTSVNVGPGRGGGGAAGAARGGAAGAGGAGRGGGPAPGMDTPEGIAARGRQLRIARPPGSLESVKQRAAQLNANGKIAQKFGMKTFVHNHSQEFDLLDDGKSTTYDVLLAETDPSLVAMQLDIGWAFVAGQDAIAMFKKNPGRYELWHVKDVAGLLDKNLQAAQRMADAQIVPIGLGNVDYKPIFENAAVAGMKHFVIEQDFAPYWGDSVAAARVSFQNLVSRVLS